jgi:hypothetical protein
VTLEEDMTDQELKNLQKKHIEVAKENNELMFMGIPDSWFENPQWMCKNGHVSGRYLKTDKGALCLACGECVILMPPK